MCERLPRLFTLKSKSGGIRKTSNEIAISMHNLYRLLSRGVDEEWHCYLGALQ